MVKNSLNPEKLRKELQSIEADIKAVVGLKRIGFGWTEVAVDIDYENWKIFCVQDVTVLICCSVKTRRDWNILGKPMIY